MTLPSPRELEREVANLRDGDDDESGIVLAYEHPETGDLLDENGEPIGDHDGVTLVTPFSVWSEWERIP